MKHNSILYNFKTIGAKASNGGMKRLIGYLKKIFYSRIVWIHCCGWGLFILYDAVIGGLVKGSFGNFGNYVVHYIININLFYFNAYVILPNAFKSRIHVFWKLPLLLLLELTSYEVITFGIDYFLLLYTNILDISGLNFDKNFTLAYIWRGLYFILFSLGYYLFLRYKLERDKNEILKDEKYDMELKKKSMERNIAEAKTAFLLAQINPHFLFNTLNFIYYSAVKNAPNSADSIMLLSKIMRYSADINNTKGLIEVRQEVEYVNWLVSIHQIRYKEYFQAEFSFTADVLNLKVIPFLIITVAENMLKHGIVTDKNHKAKMSVFKDNKNNLIICSKNKTKALSEPSCLNSGLKNLKERMDIEYQKSAKIFYHNLSDEYFELFICIPEAYIN